MASSLQFCRINLQKTSYSLEEYPYAVELTKDQVIVHWDKINQIYSQYCSYKKFTSVMPLWHRHFLSNEYKIIGYFTQQQLVAWTKLRLLDSKNIESEQFAWNYTEPNLRLGIKSLEYECAYFKNLKFDYLWLGFDDHYKQQLPGFEIAEKSS